MSEVKEITVAEVKSMHNEGKDFLLIDIRVVNEWQARHIDFAEFLPLDKISEETATNVAPDKNGLVVLYCGAGIRSLTAAKKFMDLGYTNVFSMKGGISRWKDTVS